MAETAIEQRFPKRTQSGAVEHVTWVVDVDSAATLASGAGRDRLQREIADMATHMPRWVLSVAHHKRNHLIACKHCGGMLVLNFGIRCVVCGRVSRGTRRQARLAWFGLLPPIGLDGLERVKRQLNKKGAPAQHVFSERDDIGSFLLVPLVAVYPQTFPSCSVLVAYLSGFWDIPCVPTNTASHEAHLFGDGLMCLFASGEWQPPMTCREVLQQRAYPHVIKMLNYANGKRDAFAIVS